MYLSIQYLRGIAALAIVVKHASHPGGPLERALDGGVDLFFIISGFVMVASTYGRNTGPGQFLAKRARRILPMWWLTLAVVAALGLGTGSAADWARSVVLFPSWISYGVGGVSWGVGWTLVFEAAFYLLFALGLAIRWDRFVIVALLTLVCGGLIFGRSQTPVFNTLLHPLLLEFLMGVAVARLALSDARLPSVLIVIGIGLYALGTLAPFSYEIHAITRGMPLALAVAGIVGAESRRPFPNVRILRFVGDASYSIYLLHYVAIMLAWLIIPKDSLWPITAVLGVLLGCLAYACVERPLLMALRPPRRAAEAAPSL